ncbi:MAG: hypothetical protein KAJ03_09750, partial [Gammaproteobacteria bacterium]|nr:hypothetical protein [Gammaproteobacteria bacterium]
MENNKNIDSTPDLAQADIPSGGLQKKLFRSHLTVAVIGLSMLIVALFTTLLLRSETLSLIEEREPTVHASTLALVGLERSLAALRGWVVLGDPAFKNDRTSAWNDEIQPAIAALQELSQHWVNETDKARLVELIRVLEEDKEAQWWIEDVAQTPGNRPAQLMLMQHVQPITDTIISAITALIDLEKTLKGGDNRRELQWLMADFQGSFTRIGVVLSDIINTGDFAQLENFQIFFNTAKQKMQGL